MLAGDVFDSPTPPHSSLKVYYDFLKKVSDLGVHAFIISGNHDSQGLINAPENLLKDKNITLLSKLSPKLEENVYKFEVNGEQLWIKGLPYFRNYEMVKLAQELNLFEQDLDQEELAKETLKQFFDFWPEGEPSAKMLLSHHVFGSYSPTGSEHFIGLTGIESIPMELLKDFNYAALGHIHKYQCLSSENNVFYTGSPIQMRFSENKNKFVNIVSFEDGQTDVEKLQIPIFRELIQIKTDSTSYIEDIKERLNEYSGVLQPYVEAQVDMLEAKTGMVDIIKTICEEKGAQLLSFLPNIKATNFEQEDKLDVSKIDIMELFDRFYQEKFPDQEKTPNYLKNRFKQLLEECEDENS